ncbi:MAG: tetratricopeptide repeat protein [candidate division WOR-3 bacterium]
MNKEGLRPDLNSLDVLISLADLYVENGLLEEAKDLLKTAIEENNEAIKPYISLSKIYISQGKKKEAIEILKRAFKIDSENKEIKELLNSLKEETIKEVKEAKKEKAPKPKIGGESLTEILDKLTKIKGIIGVLVVDDIGALIEGKVELPIDKESAGAIISSIFDKIQYSAFDLKIGEVSKVLLELPGGNIMVFGSKNLRFIIMTNKNVLLGELENILIEAFDKTLRFLGVE